MILQNYFNLFIKLILIILLHNLKFGKSEFYSSVHEMSRLVELEEKCLKHMQNFINKNEDKLEFLKARLAELEREQNEAHIAGSTYFNSPVNQYLLTKHLMIDWERIQNLMERRTGGNSLKNLEIKQNRSWVSYDEELNGGIAGLLRIQEVYRLKTKHIAAGILQGIQYNKELNSRLCFDIGVNAIKLGKFRLAHAWLMEALRRLPYDKDKFDIIETLDATHILLVLANAKIELGDINGANTTYAELLELKPDSETLARAYMNFTLNYDTKNSTKVDYSKDHKPIPVEILKTPQHERWKLTCSGHIKKTPREERHLRCGYLTETHPFLQLAPLKVEELNHNPLLVQYYDVLSNNEIENLKQIIATYEHRIKRATVASLNGSIVSPARTSQYLFLSNKNHKLLKIIDQRVADMTNLDMKSAEEHQFQNYGIGGHYGPHPDYFGKSLQLKKKNRWNELGDRIATVLFYLSDVEQGGGTAYPYLKQLLQPRKGAAAFWHNIHASGEGDARTIHGSCPIIVGSKWVLNRWIRAWNQDKTRPCELYNDVVHGPF